MALKCACGFVVEDDTHAEEIMLNHTDNDCPLTRIFDLFGALVHPDDDSAGKCSRCEQVFDNRGAFDKHHCSNESCPSCGGDMAYPNGLYLAVCPVCNKQELSDDIIKVSNLDVDDPDKENI